MAPGVAANVAPTAEWVQLHPSPFHFRRARISKATENLVYIFTVT